MQFFELPTFTDQIEGNLTDDQMTELGKILLENPEAGDRIKGGGGLRKIRIAASGRGKRGGGRIVYYYYIDPECIAYCRFYKKKEKDDLSKKELHAILGEISP